ncbi:MAG: GWxTD domain-containing protein [Melioribacteraceae bacterium]|nr:GWxTD domain-containing protein [Melioribacteraceae bacterium]
MNYFYVLILLLSINIFSQDKLSFEFDYARFKYDTTKTYLELYYSLGQSNLTPYMSDSNSYIGAYLDVIITDTLSKKTVVNKRYLSKTEILNLEDLSYSGKNLLGNLGFVLEGGTYKLDISATDIADSTNLIKYEEIISIKIFSSEKYSVSDIQLATRIISGSRNKESIFYKNTMEIFPNPHNIYIESMPVLFFYAELYNLNLPELQNKDLILIQQLNDSYGNTLNVKKKKLQKNNKSICEAGVINLKKYPTGSYTLILNIFEDSVNIGIASAKRFYLINPSVEQTKQISIGNLDVKSSEFGILSEEECDEMFEVSIPIAAQINIEGYKKLQDVNSKRKFLFDFWKVRDQTPETPRNEFKEEYMERVQFVEARYKTFVKRGVKTDRGRVYLMYAEPEEIDYYPSEYNMKPYEIWFYQGIEGGVTFIFGDITGYNDYELLHSTKRGEIRDESWQRRIIVD